MIVFSKEKILPTISNVMRLENDAGYFYVYRDTYDDCIILSNRYTQEELVEKIAGSEVNKEAYERLMEILPPPLDIVAGFILLVSDKLEATDEELCGVLSVVTSFMGLVRYVTSPVDIRKSVTYNKHVLEEYQLSWEKFNQLCIKWEDIETLLTPPEIHPVKEEVPVMPLYMMPQGNVPPMWGQAPQATANEESNNVSNVQFDEDNVYIPEDFDSGIDFSCLDGGDDEDAEKEKKEDSVSSPSDTKTQESDVAGYNEQEDYDKAMELLQKKPKLTARGGKSE